MCTLKSKMTHYDFLFTVRAQTLVLQIERNIAGCRGGQACIAQPSVVILNKATSQVEYGFQGSVFVQIGSSPNGYEALYMGQECDLSGCGQQVLGSLASVPFTSGVAEFEVMCHLHTHAFPCNSLSFAI
jgi:hypothetical protein